MVALLPQPKESRLITCEPYKTFTEQMRAIPHRDRDGARIEIPIPEESSFCSSFLYPYSLGAPTIIMKLLRVSNDGDRERYLIRLALRVWIDEDEPLSVYSRSAAAIMRQASLFYIPDMSVDVTVHVNGAFELQMDALLPEEANLIQSGYLLLNQVVTMFTFQNEEE